MEQNNLSLNLIPVGVKEVFATGFAPCPLYYYSDNGYQLYKDQGHKLSKEDLRELLVRKSWILFISFDDFIIFKNYYREQLRKVTRSLSVGNSIGNVKKMTNLLTIHLGMIYRDPTDDESLSLQYQSIKTLIGFILDNKKYLPELYKSVEEFGHFYTYSQPLLSSLMLMGILLHTQIFNNREIELLFITSYFKDIGMALVPQENYLKQNLTSQEKKTIKSHGQNSLKILSGRISLGQNYNTIIANHHIHSHIDDNIKLVSDKEIMGIETLFLAIADMLTAMSSTRPYRKSMDIFESLKYLKTLVSSEYPQEFKILVHFISKFYRSKTK
ncbi:MAG: hypothetical protein HOE90_02980 [Bacteriovoracaceae bacterium]|nr:hypothetical protein [Bacteriovoracaceae bacterium]